MDTEHILMWHGLRGKLPLWAAARELPFTSQSGNPAAKQQNQPPRASGAPILLVPHGVGRARCGHLIIYGESDLVTPDFMSNVTRELIHIGTNGFF